MKINNRIAVNTYKNNENILVSTTTTTKNELLTHRYAT